MRLRFLAVSLVLMLTGCSFEQKSSSTAAAGLRLQGSVHGGQQPVIGAHVYLMAANTTGYGNASISLLNAASTGASDAIGAYVTSGGGGSFTITGDYTCTPGSQVYLYAVGGNPGAGINTAAGFLAVLGQCPSGGNFLAATPFISVNELTTISAAYSFAGFATDATHVSSSGTTAGLTGIANAFATAGNLVSISNGTALQVTPAGNGLVPQTRINTLANILAACVNTSAANSSPCTTLFQNTQSGGSNGTMPTDTATAAINMAHNPGTNIHALYSVITGTPPFQPSAAVEPPGLSIGLQFVGGGMYGITSIAVDSAGNVWTANLLNNSLSKLSNLGAPISPAAGFTGGGLSNPDGIAIDPAGNVWASNQGAASVSKFSNAGIALSPAVGFTGGGLSAPVAIAIDGAGSAWVTNGGYTGAIAKISNSGTPLSPTTGFTNNGVVGENFTGIAIDPMGDAWITLLNDARVSKLSPAGVTLSPANGYSTGVSSYPQGIAFDNAGNAWIGGNGVPIKLSNTGVQQSLAPGITFFGGQGPYELAVDGAGNVWYVSYQLGNGITALSSSGVPLFPYSSFLGQPTSSCLAIDGSGNVWAGASIYAVELVGAATPVVTPMSLGIANATLATRP